SLIILECGRVRFVSTILGLLGRGNERWRFLRHWSRHRLRCATALSVYVFSHLGFCFYSHLCVCVCVCVIRSVMGNVPTKVLNERGRATRPSTDELLGLEPCWEKLVYYWYSL